ncbi:MAG TPA: hypothetical protein VMW47_12905 [Verrucomicrobiae bacterium]|nr:hypothetical protein [Verrucomicrobiae bacterium]
MVAWLERHPRIHGGCRQHDPRAAGRLHSSVHWSRRSCSPPGPEHFPANLVAQRCADLQAFVTWLKGHDVPAPTCCDANGQLVHRLAALHAWTVRAYGPDPHPRDAAEWWAVGPDRPKTGLGGLPRS